MLPSVETSNRFEVLQEELCTKKDNLELESNDEPHSSTYKISSNTNTSTVEKIGNKRKLKENSRHFSNDYRVFKSYEPQVKFSKCSKCKMFPHPKLSHLPNKKFCKWATERKIKKKNETNLKDESILSPELINLIKARIDSIEATCAEELHSCDNIKLKGGFAGRKKINESPIFSSKSDIINVISSIWSSLGNAWSFFDDHKLCKHSEKKTHRLPLFVLLH